MDALQLLGSLLGNNATSSGIGGQILGQLIGSLTGGGAQSGGGGLASVLSGLTGGAQSGGAGGGLASVLSGLTGGGAQSGGGGLASALSSLAGGGSQGGIVHSGLVGGLVMTALQIFSQHGAAPGSSSLTGLAEMLSPSQATAGQATPAAVDTAQFHQQALVLIKAMINAAKADGQIDAQEQQNIASKLSDVGPQEMEFVKQEIAKPLNLDFLNEVNPNMATHVYMVSLMAINLDTEAEASYMQQLAQSLGLDAQTVNGIHQQLDLAPLFS
ncbi:MAG: DUF533 domain-containing protein [Candidatus Competibacteraceae bacterium]